MTWPGLRAGPSDKVIKRCPKGTLRSNVSKGYLNVHGIPKVSKGPRYPKVPRGPWYPKGILGPRYSKGT